jgi:hypothetical protein
VPSSPAPSLEAQLREAQKNILQQKRIRLDELQHEEDLLGESLGQLEEWLAAVHSTTQARQEPSPTLPNIDFSRCLSLREQLQRYLRQWHPSHWAEIRNEAQAQIDSDDADQETTRLQAKWQTSYTHSRENFKNQFLAEQHQKDLSTSLREIRDAQAQKQEAEEFIATAYTHAESLPNLQREERRFLSDLQLIRTEHASSGERLADLQRWKMLFQTSLDIHKHSSQKIPIVAQANKIQQEQIVALEKECTTLQENLYHLEKELEIETQKLNGVKNTESSLWQNLVTLTDEASWSAAIVQEAGADTALPARVIQQFTLLSQAYDQLLPQLGLDSIIFPPETPLTADVRQLAIVADEQISELTPYVVQTLAPGYQLTDLHGEKSLFRKAEIVASEQKSRRISQED